MIARGITRHQEKLKSQLRDFGISSWVLSILSIRIHVKFLSFRIRVVVAFKKWNDGPFEEVLPLFSSARNYQLTWSLIHAGRAHPLNLCNFVLIWWAFNREEKIFPCTSLSLLYLFLLVILSVPHRSFIRINGISLLHYCVRVFFFYFFRCTARITFNSKKKSGPWFSNSLIRTTYAQN